jgi:hypothetical protein
MRDKWRRMKRRDLMEALKAERAKIDAEKGSYASLVAREYEAKIDEIMVELSRRDLTLYAGVGAVAAVVAAVASVWQLLK